MPDDVEATRAGPTRASLGVTALAVLVLAGSVGLFIQGSCTPSGATKVPHDAEPVQADTDEPDPKSLDLMPDVRRPPAVT